MKISTLVLFLMLFIQFDSRAQYGFGDNTTEKQFRTILKAADRASRDITELPSSFSLKKYAPSVGHQHLYGTCVAWSTSYAARTISYAIKKNLTNTEAIDKIAFSPGYIYYKIKRPEDLNCTMGSAITQAMQVMRETGNIFKSEGVFDCTPTISPKVEQQKASSFKIKDFIGLTKYNEITKNDILKIKKSLTEKKPVVFSLDAYQSFLSVSPAGMWTPTENDVPKGGHAMCIVGYDDNVAGGAFEVMNSWGSLWGNKGFFWLTYPQLIKFGNYAVEMMDFENKPQQEELSGNIEFIKLDETVMPVKRTKINTRSMSVEDDNKAEYSLYKLTETYPGGTPFKLKFTTNAPAYVYIFGEDDKGVISKLFPYDDKVSAAINSSNATVYLPSETKHAKLSYTPGKENICVLYSKTELNFESLLTYINTSKSNISEAVKNLYASKLMNIKKIKFDDDSINFKAPVDESSLLCFFIELAHN